MKKEGYAQHLLDTNKPASGETSATESLQASSTPRSSMNEDEYESDDEDENEVASAHASLYVHTGGGSFAKSRMWKGRSTGMICEEDIAGFTSPFSRPPSSRGSSEERPLSLEEGSRIKIVEEGVAESILERGFGREESEEGGLVRRVEGSEEKKGMGKGKVWKKVFGGLGCGGGV
jgi:hypothetical protein